MARQSISVAVALCFLAYVCVHVDAQFPPQGTPMMPPEGAPMMPPIEEPIAPPPMMATPPMMPPMSPPVPTPSETPTETPVSAPAVVDGPGPLASPASSASTIVPSAAFALLGAAAFFF